MTRLLFICVTCAALISGCAHSAPEPNKAQKWGVWSYLFPWSKGATARKAEKKDDKLDEDKRGLTKAVDDLLKRGSAISDTNPAIRAAALASEENVVIHGTPAIPINVEPLVSTNAPSRDKAWDDLMSKFHQQQKDVAYIRGVFERQQKEGQGEEKQHSSAKDTAWKIKDAIINFINAHWFVMLIFGVILFYVGKAALAVWNPALAIGVNKVQGIGMNGIKTIASEVIKGGELFQEKVENEFKHNPEIMFKIKQMFRESHERAQSDVTQIAIKTLTN